MSTLTLNHTTAAPVPDLKVAEVAALLRVAKPFVYEAIKSGDLPAYRLGPNGLRIRPADLDAWRDSLTVTSDAGPVAS